LVVPLTTNLDRARLAGTAVIEATERRVDHERDRTVQERVDYMRAAFGHLVHRLDRDARGGEVCGRATRRQQAEAEAGEPPGGGGRAVPIFRPHADEGRSRKRQHRAGGDFGLGKRAAERVADPHSR
jgi:hypothetical protein